VKLFLPQKTLEDWSGSEKADLEDGKLVVKDKDKSTHAVTPAVHFVKVISGTDAHQLTGRVKTMKQLDELGAEHMMDSVLLGETAFEVVPGYVAEVPLAPPAGKPDPKKKPISPEADLLAAFILDKL
jgi:hypothetical protein